MRKRIHSSWMLAAAVALIGVTAYCLNAWRWGMVPDTSWLITVIERIGAGDVLYKDIIELNPPFSIWLYLAPVHLAGLIGASPETVVWLYVLAICLAGTSLTGWMLSQAGILEQRAATSVAVLLFAITVLLSGNSFTERDQIGAVLALPLFVLAAWRARPVTGLVPAARHWFVAGLGAGILAMVKPYYAVVVVAVACLLAVRRRDVRMFLLPEFVLSGVIALAYLALGYALYPAFFTRLVPLLQDTYMAFGWPLDLLMLMAAPWLALPLAYAFRRRLLDLPELSDFLMVGALAAWIPYFLQGKGWPYHAYPAILFGSAALVVALATLFEKRPYEARIGHMVIVAAAILLAHMRFAYSERPAAALVAAGLREGGNPTVGMLGGGIEKGHPLTRMINGRWTDLYCSDWIPVYAVRRAMNLAAAGQNDGVERFMIMKAQYYAAKYARLAEHPPQLLIVDRGDGVVTDMVAQFGFDALLARYQRIASDGNVELYRLQYGAKAAFARDASLVSASD